jgi:long-chain fatty acid transport protein
VGGTHYFDNGLHVSAGYIFNENSVPDANFSPAVADLDRHFFSAGIGYKGKWYDLDLAYQFGYGPTRTVTGSGLSATGQTADGKYDFTSHLVAVSVGVRF